MIIEAHACEIPVIGSDSGAIPEVINEGGLIAPEGNSAKLTEAIKTLRDDPVLCRTMGQAGRRQVEDLYTWQRVSERMREISIGKVMASERTHEPALQL